VIQNSLRRNDCCVKQSWSLSHLFEYAGSRFTAVRMESVYLYKFRIKGAYRAMRCGNVLPRSLLASAGAIPDRAASTTVRQVRTIDGCTVASGGRAVLSPPDKHEKALQSPPGNRTRTIPVGYVFVDKSIRTRSELHVAHMREVRHEYANEFCVLIDQQVVSPLDGRKYPLPAHLVNKDRRLHSVITDIEKDIRSVMVLEKFYHLHLIEHLEEQELDEIRRAGLDLLEVRPKLTIKARSLEFDGKMISHSVSHLENCSF
jgi:hypothetical protein